MWTIEQVAVYFKQQTTDIFEIFDKILDAFQWTIVASVSVVLLLYMVYSIAPPPMHPLGLVVP